MQQNKITVQTARKSVYILRYGELTGPHCFDQNLILATHKEDKNTLGWAALPHGWKVCFVEQFEAWTFETRWVAAGTSFGAALRQR